MTRRLIACAAAAGVGLSLLVASLPFWSEFLTTNPSERPDGHGFVDFYLFIFLMYDVPALVLLGLAYRVARVGKRA